VLMTGPAQRFPIVRYAFEKDDVHDGEGINAVVNGPILVDIMKERTISTTYCRGLVCERLELDHKKN